MNCSSLLISTTGKLYNNSFLHTQLQVFLSYLRLLRTQLQRYNPTCALSCKSQILCAHSCREVLRSITYDRSMIFPLQYLIHLQCARRSHRLQNSWPKPITINQGRSSPKFVVDSVLALCNVLVDRCIVRLAEDSALYFLKIWQLPKAADLCSNILVPIFPIRGQRFLFSYHSHDKDLHIDYLGVMGWELNFIGLHMSWVKGLLTQENVLGQQGKKSQSWIPKQIHSCLVWLTLIGLQPCIYFEKVLFYKGILGFSEKGDLT